MSSASLLDLRGSAKMALLSKSNKTMIYLLPRLEVTGKRPVWSVETLPVMVMRLAKTKLVRVLGSVGAGDVDVERIFFRR